MGFIARMSMQTDEAAVAPFIFTTHLYPMEASDVSDGAAFRVKQMCLVYLKKSHKHTSLNSQKCVRFK